MTPNQSRTLTKRPHLGNLFRNATNEEAGQFIPPSPRTPLPVCIHRGDILDVTTCRCKVWHCKKHGTCSDNKRAGLRVCKECPDFTPPPSA